MLKKKVIISACLLGELCRYDAKTKINQKIIDTYKNYEVIPFCPEAPLFGTPRQRISVIEIYGKNRIITDESNEDVTQKLQDEIERFISLHKDVDTIVLKSKSPSCGLGSTPILDKDRNIIRYGNGIAADIFTTKLSDVKITDEI